jgi:hypothetical protein
VAATALVPPRAHLSWADVVEYAFLADFDLLRDARQDIRERPWARPACRITMDTFFKMGQAREEIKRLNVEIPRVVTSIVDEEAFLLEKEAECRVKDLALAHQISLYRMERGCSNTLHMQRF